LHGDRTSTQLANIGSRLFGDIDVVVGEYQISASVGQAQCDALANASTGTRHQGDFACQGEIDSFELAHVMPLFIIVVEKQPSHAAR
jgi:hypothetical protein